MSLSNWVEMLPNMEASLRNRVFKLNLKMGPCRHANESGIGC